MLTAQNRRKRFRLAVSGYFFVSRANASCLPDTAIGHFAFPATLRVEVLDCEFRLRRVAKKLDQAVPSCGARF